MKKILKYLFLFLIGVGIAGYIYLRSLAPQLSGTIKVPEGALSSKVDAYFDDYGIPHIYAANNRDAYYALGYIHAQDRLFQMEMLRRVMSGRLAEILGKDLIDADKYFRTLGMNRMAKKTAEKYFSEVTEDWQKEVLAYLDGVNDFVKNGKTPVEFSLIGIPKEEFTPQDIYGILAYMGLGFSSAIKQDFLWDKIHRMGADYSKPWVYMPEEKSKISPGEEMKEEIGGLYHMDTEYYLHKAGLSLWDGSNGWVISREKSKSGSVILCNDTHIWFSQPSVWYEAHLNYPGYDFYGNYLAGVPFGVIGHNRNLGWGLTIFPFDNMDMYREKPNPDHPGQVRYNDHWEDLKIITEKIKVKDGQDVDYQVKISRHGPIINDVKPNLAKSEKEPVALWWTYLQQPSPVLQVLREIGHCKKMEEIVLQLEKIDFLGLNFLYGDVDGNFAKFATGKVPNRPDHVNSYLILDGSTDNDEPRGYIPFSENPHIVNPPSGFVASGNDKPKNGGNTIFRGYYPPDNRFNRISKYLSENKKWDIEMMKQIQLDDVSDEYKKISRLIASVIDKSSLSEIQTQGLKVLETWDGSYGLTNPAPAIFTKVLYHLFYEAMVDEIGEEAYAALRNSYVFKTGYFNFLRDSESPWWDNIDSKQRETRQQIFTKAFKLSIDEMVGQLGDKVSEWKWEKVHTVTHPHPLGKKKPLNKIFDVGPLVVGGGNDVPNKMMYDVDGDGLYQVTSGPALRILIDFADVDHSQSINPTGQSGNVMSPHYKDQSQMYVDGIYRPQMMKKSEIMNSKNHLVFEP